MRVARLHDVGTVRIHDEPTPKPGDGEELIQVEAVGICGSDLHWFGEGAIGDAQLERPLVLGHEFAGTIRGGIRDGVRVAVDPAIPCETCAWCRSGDENLCSDLRFAGHGSTDGALREYMAWPSHLLHPVPGMSATDAALLEPLGVALHAVDLSHPTVGDTVAVVGCGPIGLLLVQAARLGGAARVIGVEPLPHRRRMARDAGADVVVDPEDIGDLDGVADIVHEVAGVQESVDLAARLARPGARVLLTGIPDGDRTTFRASTARRRALSLVHVRRMRAAYPRAIELVRGGRIELGVVPMQAHGLEDVSTALARAAGRAGGKVVVTP